MQIQYYEFNLKKSFLYDEKFCFSYEYTINLYYIIQVLFAIKHHRLSQ